MTLLIDPANYSFDLIDALYLVSGILILAQGIVVSFRERGTSIGYVYLLFALSISGWAFNNGLLMASQNEAIASQLILWSNLPVIFIPATVFHYTRILLDLHQQQTYAIRTAWIISSIFALALIFELDFASARLYSFGYYSIYGIGGYLFLIYFGLCIGWAYYTFIKKSYQMEHNPDSQKRFRWLTSALILSLFATTDFIAVFGIDTQPIGVLFALLLFTTTTYVTWRFRLTDICSEYITNNLLEIIRNPIIVIDRYAAIAFQNKIAINIFSPEHLTRILDFLVPKLNFLPTDSNPVTDQLFTEFSIELEDFVHTYEIAISPIYSRQGVLLAYTSLFTDISVITQYQKSLEQSRNELELRVVERTKALHEEIGSHKKTVHELEISRQIATEASQTKSVFLSRMSHELRTPLNAIMGFSQLIQMDAENISQTDQLNYIRHIHEAGTHLTSLIDDVLDLSRIELDRLKLLPEVINIPNIINDCVSYVGLMASTKGVNIDVDTESCSTLNIRTDKTRLKQILINILTNAIKYNKPNGSVVIKCSTNHTNVRISITDTGIGIPKDTAEKVFIPFERLSNVLHDSDGAGIGLSLSKHLVELQGGTIGYESEQDIGSTFWFELPGLIKNTINHW